MALLPSLALAQEADVRSDAPVHLGPLFITPVLELARLGVDSNVFLSEGNPQSDFTITAGPKVDIALPLRRFVVTAETVTDFVYFKQFKNQRGVNFTMNLRGELQLARLRLFVEDSFLNTRERPNLEIDARARRQENATRAGVGVGVFRKLEVEVSARQASLEYDRHDPLGAGLARQLNSNFVATSAAVRYKATPLTTLEVTAETRKEQFSSAPDRDNESWSVVPGIELNPRALISGTAKVGYRSLRGSSSVLPPYQGPVAAVELDYTLLESSTISFTADRDIAFSFQVFEPYYVSTGYGVSFEHRFTDRFEIDVGTRWFDSEYRAFVSTANAAPTGRVDTWRSYSVGLQRRLNRSTTIGVDASHFSRRSNRAGLRDYDGLLMGLTSTFAF